ncbi:DMT family transporter [Amaricoccus sp.]|uniref:DMT family transporter n=1 Tax=Amaricoccus sp. TaxID=1872485 RepID=UPI001B6E6E14|nr:DMT family transporter [Amaricoccus sp.]MBP7001292.1 DMT family transporter [Amaricoccus sp.]
MPESPAPSAAAPAARPSRPLKAFAWMLGAIASFAAMAVAGREIQVEMNTFELMLYRSAIGFAVIAAIVLASRRPGEIVATRHPWLHVRRNAAHYLGQNLWFYAVTLVPLGQLAALEFTNPIWVVLLAPFFLAETMTPARLVAAALGFAGVLIVAQPGAGPFGSGQAAALGAGLAFAFNTIYTRRIMAFDPVLCVLFWMTLSQGLASLVLSLPGGVPVPSAAVAPWLAVVGLTGLTAHYCLTSALANAPASVVAPMEFLRLPVVATLGMIVYHEPLRLSVFVGAAVIVVGNLVGIRAARRGAA